MATGPEHYTEAERLLTQSRTWEDADTGWKAHISTEERMARRMADLAEAQVHATLAKAAATALNDTDPNGAGMAGDDFIEWRRVASISKQKTND